MSDQEYDTLELTKEDIMDSMEHNLNELTAKGKWIISTARSGLKVTAEDFAHAERTASYFITNLMELKQFFEKKE